MIKWPERHEVMKGYTDEVNRECLVRNATLDACRAAVEEVCEREVLAKIIHEAYWPNTSFEQAIEIDRESAFNIADAIRHHLNLEDMK